MSSRFARWAPSVAFAVLFVVLHTTNRASAQLCGQLAGVNFTENFNSLALTGSSNSLSNQFEFAFVKTSGLTYATDNGSLSTANAYSYGTTGNFDRALGELTSGSQATTIGACFTNNTDHAITSFLIAYTGEEWRLGVADATVDSLHFEYSTNATSITAGTFIAVPELDFDTPANSGAGAKDGNMAANRIVFAPFAITPAAPIQPEATCYIHWLSENISGANDGLAIDDFSIGTALAPGLAADYNDNGIVDAADYVVWRKNLNQSVTIPNDITPGTVIQQDYNEWTQRFGKSSSLSGGSGAISSATVPEPAALPVMMFAATASTVLRRLPRVIRSY